MNGKRGLVIVSTSVSNFTIFQRPHAGALIKDRLTVNNDFQNIFHNIVYV